MWDGKDIPMVVESLAQTPVLQSSWVNSLPEGLLFPFHISAYN